MPIKSTIVRFMFINKNRLQSVLAPHAAAQQLEHLFLTPQQHPRPEREIAWMNGARRQRIALDTTRQLALYEWGDGPVILLIHGFSGRASQMAVYAAPLVAAGFKVVAFDAPAHGESDGSQTGLPEFADAVARVALHLGPLHACIAHSNGAAACTVALQRGMQCARVAYIAAPEDLQQYLQRLGQWLGFSTRAIWATQRRIEQRYGVTFAQLRGSTIAAQLNTPALIIHDQFDPVVPFSDGQTLQQAWKNAEFQPTEGLGHSRIVREPSVLNAVLRFISQTQSAAA